MAERGFASVILDVDSTLAGLEGIDWLAALRGTEIAGRVAGLTMQAMTGELTLDEVFSERLRLVRPNAKEVEKLSAAYCETVAPGAVRTVHALRQAGVKVTIVTSGILQAVADVAMVVGVSKSDVHAVSVRFDRSGEFAGFDDSPLTRAAGKRLVVEALPLPRRIVAIGDGMTDAELKPVVDAFAAYTGFVRREPVVACADHVVESFADVRRLVTGS